MGRVFCIEASGDYACFTRPEFRVERFSYEVMTPSSARGVFSAIFWKPEIDWDILRVDVMNPIRFDTIMLNEVKKTASRNPIYAEDHRDQRSCRVLRDVKYRIFAEPVCTRPGLDVRKYWAIFERRASRGQCYKHPFLGTRNFSCSSFRLIRDEELPNEPLPIRETRNLGIMHYDMDFSNPSHPMPLWFDAQMEDGSIVMDRRIVEVMR